MNLSQQRICPAEKQKITNTQVTALKYRVVRKPVNTNPGLKVNQSINFSGIKMFFTAHIFCGLSLVKLKTEGQTL